MVEIVPRKPACAPEAPGTSGAAVRATAATESALAQARRPKEGIEILSMANQVSCERSRWSVKRL
jgi:hypothetical protein